MSPDTVPRQRPTKPASRGAVLAVVLIYALFASCWILLSDKLVQIIFTDPDRIILVSTLKGWLFVLVTSLLLYGLMRRWVAGATSSKPVAAKSRKTDWIFLLLALVVVIFTCATIFNNLNHHKQAEVAQLDAKIDMKAQQIADWFRQRQNSVDFILTSEYMAEHYRNWQEANDLLSAEKLKIRLEQFRKISDFTAITLLDSPGNRLWASAQADAAVNADLQAVARLVAKDRKVRQLGPYINATNDVCLDFIVPLNAKAERGAVLILQINLAESLIPILHTWSLTNDAIDVLLFRSNSGEVLYINEFKNRNNRAGELRMLAATEKPFTARLLRNGTSPGSWLEDVDSKGIPFIGMVRAIPGTDWFLMFKRDSSVFYAEAVENAMWLSFVGLFGLFVVGASFYLIQQNQQLAVAQAIQQSQAEKLRAMQLLAAIADSSDDAIFAKDRTGRYILFNTAASRFIDKPVEDVLGYDDRYIFPPKQAEMLMEVDRQALAGQGCIDREEVLNTVQGERVFLATKGPLHDSDGNVIGTFGICRDITERKYGEAALQGSEQRYRWLFENMMNGYAHCLMLFDDGKPVDFVYLDVNKAFEIQTGLRDVVGRKVSEIVPGIREADPQLFEVYGRVAMGSGAERFETYVEALQNWYSVSVHSPEREHFVAVFEVVTERKQAEIALRKSEERLRLAQTSANVGIWDWDLNSGKLDWTEELETLYGYRKGAFPGSYQAFRDCVHPDDVVELERLQDEAVKAQLPFDFDFRIRLPSGATKWVNCKGGAAYDESGKPQRVFGVNIDITERKRIEAELRLWAQLFEQAHFGLVIADAASNTFLAVNPTFARERGYSRDEMIGKPIMTVYPEELIETVKNTIQAVDVTSHGVYETEHVCKNGRRFPVMIDLTTIKAADGTAQIRIAYALDISERKRAEQALSISERRFRQLFDLAPMPLAIVNKSGMIVAVNTRLVDVFGYTISDIPTLDVWWPCAYPDPDYRRMVMTSWNAAVQYAMDQGADIPQKEYRITCKGGEVRTMLISGILIENDILITFFDISELRAAEDALRVRERYQRAVLDNFPFMVWLKDTDSRILAANKTYARVANVFNTDELIGKTDLDYWEPEQAERYRADDRAVLDSGCSKTIEEEINEAGRRLWIETYKSPVQLDGRIIGTVGFARDITDKKQADDRLRISEARLQLALDATNDGLWDWDLRSGQAYLTPRYYDIVGYRPDEVTSDFDFFKRTVYQDDLSRVLETINAHLQGRTPASNFDYRVVTSSGEIKWIRGRGKVVERDAEGKPLRMIGTITDISEQKAAEELLCRQSEELAQRNKELERFNRVMVGRELDMIGLKQQVNALSRELGLEPPHSLAFLDALPEAPKDGETS